MFTGTIWILAHALICLWQVVCSADGSVEIKARWLAGYISRARSTRSWRMARGRGNQLHNYIYIQNYIYTYIYIYMHLLYTQVFRARIALSKIFIASEPVRWSAVFVSR